MKRLGLLALALSMLAGSAGLASAQPHGHGGPFVPPGHDRGEHRGWHGEGRSDWRHGGYVVRPDWDRGRVIDYRAYRLRAPPPGYQWRMIDGRYVLAAIATGVIADIILNAVH